MAISWGSWEGHLRVGVEATRDGYDYSFKWYVGIDGWTYDDDQALNYSGDISGSTSFHNSLSGSHSSHQGSVTASKLIATKTYHANPGESVSVTATLSGSYLGETPSKTYSTTAPTIGSAAKPSATSITKTTANISWSLPSNASSIQLQVDDSSGFGSPHADYRDSASPSSPFSGPDTVSSGFIGGPGTPNKTYYARIRGYLDGEFGAWSPTLTFTLLPDVPAAPTGVVATRVSDTSITVNWALATSSTAPYASQNVQRKDSVDDVWVTIASGVSGSATSYSDTTAAANHKYFYRIQSVNASGSAYSTGSAAVYTTPAAPVMGNAVKDAVNNIVITWTNKSRYTEYLTEVWESQDGGAFVLLADNVASGATSYTHVSPNTAVTHAYQVRHKTTVPSPTLFSAFSAVSNTVQLAAPPAAPTALSPNGETLDATLDILLTWQHTPVDSSPQSKFQLQHRAVGAGVWSDTGVITSGVSEWTLPANTYPNGTAIEWQVKTWGQHVDPSPFSATAVFNSSTPPTVSITSPADAAVLGSSLLTVEWSYFDAESTPQTGYRITLIQDGVPLEVLTAANADTITTFATPLLDGGTYTIEAQVRDSDDMVSAVDTITVTVDYLPPANVDLIATYDEPTGTVVLNLQPEPPEDGVSVDAETVDIERRIDGGKWIVIAQGVPADSTVLDIAPGIHNTNEYRVTVYSATPSSAVMDPTTIVETCEINRGFLSTGLSFENIIVIDGAVGVAVSTSRDKVLHHFAGRRYAVEFMGTAFDKVVNVTGTLYEENGTATDMEQAAQTASIVMWRDPSGRRIFGSLGPVSTTLVDMSSPNVWTTGFAVSEVDYAG